VESKRQSKTAFSGKFAVMSFEKGKTVRVAILDLYDGYANQGMRCIRELLNLFGDQHHINLVWDEFDVRKQNAIPDLSYDIFISTGGPGSPFDGEGLEWEENYFNWLRSVEDWNADEQNDQKKYVFFICHSFQMACRYYNVGTVCRRKSTAFGVFPIHFVNSSKVEGVFDGLKDPFYGVDSRDFQVVQPNVLELKNRGIRLLCIEKDRPHVALERAIMAVRFNDYMIGTQFHPEADAPGMSMYLQTEEKKKTVIENHGFEKWKSMIEHLNDPDKIMWTYAHILPNFLFKSIFKKVPAIV
jgi:homoserine O-succinyltransferase/O-acetyltransferase